MVCADVDGKVYRAKSRTLLDMGVALRPGNVLFHITSGTLIKFLKSGTSPHPPIMNVTRDTNPCGWSW
jgi:hypothetical protein